MVMGSNKTNMNLLDYSFEGPFSIDTAFNAVAGIYLILTPKRNQVVDVGQTDNLGQRIPSHERKDSWKRCGGSELWFHRESVTDTRLVKEARLRKTYDPL